MVVKKEKIRKKKFKFKTEYQQAEKKQNKIRCSTNITIHIQEN